MLTPKMCEARAEPSLAAVTANIAQHWPSDFCWSSCFEPTFLAALMYEGYLPTAHGPVVGPVEYILLPKLHQERCIMLFEDLHVTRSARSSSRAYQLSVDTAFDEVVEKCLAQHGESWLHPPIVDGFKRLFRCGGSGQVKMHSIEVKRGGKLVAGELGYSVGKTYCSLSGFTTVSGSGSVQCLGLALLLHQRGFDFWDLGMGMEYKLKMGAREIDRSDFLRKLRASRDLPCNDLSLPGVDASQMLVPRFQIGCYVRVCHSHAAYGGKVGIVCGHKGAHFQVRIDHTRESVALPREQVQDVYESDDAELHSEQQLEDGSVVLKGLERLPQLVWRPPDFSRSRRNHKKKVASVHRMYIAEDGGASDTRDSAVGLAPASSCAQGPSTCNEDAESREKSGRLELRGGGQDVGADAGGQIERDSTMASRSKGSGSGGDDAERCQEWSVKRCHHVGWHAAARHRRQMRELLLKGGYCKRGWDGGGGGCLDCCVHLDVLERRGGIKRQKGRDGDVCDCVRM